MTQTARQQALEQAFDRIEETILPTLSMMLDALIDSATRADAGEQGEIHAKELRTIGLQLEELTRQIETVSPARPDEAERSRSAA